MKPYVVPLACPSCHASLKADDNSLVCSSCGSSYSVCDGIPCFVELDELYEGRFTQTIYHKGKRPLSTKALRTRFSKRGQFFRKGIRKGSLILDLGCGGGNTFFTTFGTVVGIDISLSSVQAASKVYSQVACGDILKLPFFDESFDYVISENVVEHISLDRKDHFIEEMYRVTKRGGGILHAITVEGENGFTKLGKKHPALYRRYFIDELGHFGLESASANLARLKRAGFKVLWTKQAYTSWFRPIGEYLDKFDNEYRDLEPGLRGPLSVACLVEKRYPLRILKKPVHFSLTCLKSFVDSGAPLGKGDLLYVCCEKE